MVNSVIAGALLTLMIFFASPVADSLGEPAAPGRISGKLLVKGGTAMGGGMVYIFNAEAAPPPDPDKFWRVPDEFADIENDGKFTIELPEGKYHLGAIKRGSGNKEIGPPVAGDIFYKGQDEKGSMKLHTVKAGKTLKLGDIAEAVLYSGPAIKETAGFEGTVFLNEAPVEGAVVLAYFSPTMLGKPNLVSNRTGTNGKYLLRVYRPGAYYLKVRNVYGGGPLQLGHIIGFHGDEYGPLPAVVKNGELKSGVDIRVELFKGRRQRR